MSIRLSRSQPTAMEFDGKLLIREVKKRPLLYQKTTHDYSNLAERRRAWLEICDTLVRGWEKLNAAEQERAIFLANKRWQNMRNCFMRELKMQKNEEGASNPRRRKYYYYDDMLFLVGESADDNVNDQEKREDEERRSDDSSDDDDNDEDSSIRNKKYNKFDTIELIKAVEAEPVLYDRAMEQNSKVKDERRDAWNRVAVKIHGAEWRNWKSKQRLDAVSIIKTRWNNLRTCFRREQKLKRKQPNTTFSNKKRREYVFFKPLRFLLPHVDEGSRTKGAEPQDDEEEVEEEDESDHAEYLEDDSDDNYFREVSDEDPEDCFSGNSSRKSKRLDTSDEVKREKVEIVSTSTSLIEDPLHPQYDGKPETIDQDVNFALSLVPMMRGLSATRKLEIQIEILRLFKNVSTKNVSAADS